MKEYNIYMEGDWSTGMDSPSKARYLGKAFGNNFAEACSNFIKDKWGEKDWGTYFHILDDGTPCAYSRMFETLEEAQKSFG